MRCWGSPNFTTMIRVIKANLLTNFEAPRNVSKCPILVLDKAHIFVLTIRKKSGQR